MKLVLLEHKEEDQTPPYLGECVQCVVRDVRDQVCKRINVMDAAVEEMSAMVVMREGGWRQKKMIFWLSHKNLEKVPRVN